MSRLTLRTQAALLLLTVLILVTAVFTILRQLGQNSSDLTATGNAVQVFGNANRDFDAGMLNQETGVRGYALTADTSFLDPYESGRAMSAGARKTLEARVRPEARSLLAREEAAANSWQMWASARVAAVKSAGPGGSTADHEGRSLFDAYRAAASALDAHDATIAAAVVSNLADVQNRQDQVRLVGWLLLIAVLLFLAALIFRSILRPLERQAQFLGLLSPEEEIPVPGLGRRDEIGRLGSALAELQRSLRDRHRLTQATMEVSGQSELDEVVARGLRQLAELLDADETVCTVLTGTGRRIAGSYRGLFQAGEEIGQRTAGDEALATHGTVISSAAEMGPGPIRDRLMEGGYDSLIVLPMLSGGDELGTATSFRRTGRAPFDSTDAARAEVIVPFIAAAVKVATLVNELRSANMVKSRFLANMSHELRTPLNAILGFSQVLSAADFGPLNERQQRYVGHIENSGRRLLDLINDILDLAKVEAGLMEVRVDTVELGPVLLESRSEIERMVEAKGLTLSYDLEHGLWVRAEARRLQQVVINLLSNAVKFTPSGGAVAVASKQVATDRAEVTIRDTGVGIALQDQERIFDEFAQVSDPEQEHQGTGLGLSLSRRLTELMGGELTVASEPGKGSTFTISLAAEAPRGSAAAGATVLVVEDEAPNREYISMLLEEGGYRTVSVADVDQARRAVEREKPAAVILDILLPDVDGWALVESLRADAATAGIPVIVVSATEPPPAHRLAEVREFLTKPVTGQELLSAVERAIAVSEARG